MKPSKIDFSKIKIPSFLAFLEKEGEKKESNNSNNSNEIRQNIGEIKNWKNIIFTNIVNKWCNELEIKLFSVLILFYYLNKKW